MHRVLKKTPTNQPDKNKTRKDLCKVFSLILCSSQV